ncbi:reverse transcriptase domain-containing protein [Tanacetum coccineum]
MADNRTMAQMLQAPIEGYEDAIVVPPINANNFELKQPLINLVQSNKFTGRQDPHNHLRFFNKVTSTFRHPEVPNTSVKLLLFPFSLDGEARDWLDKEPPRSILTWDDLVSKFINQYFPPSKTTYYRNEIITFYQKPNEAFNEAWERFKGLLRQYALDSAAGGNFLDKMPQEGLAIIESKSKVRYSRSRANDSRVSTDAPLSNSSSSNNSFDMQQIAASLEDKMTIKMNQMMSQMKALVVSHQSKQLRKNQMANVTSLLTSLCDNFKNSASTSNSGTLPSQTVTNPRQQINAITTRSGKALEEPSIPLVPTPDVSKPQKEPEQNPETSTEKVQNPNLENTAHVPPPGEEDLIFMEIPNPKAKKTINVEIQDLNSPNPNSNQSRLPYPERMKVREHDKPSAQYSRFLKMFKQLRLEIGLKDALVEMPKFNKWLSSLLRNKEKLEEIAITTVNAECSAIIMNKVPEKLEDPGKFLIPCALQELDRTSALADSGASINLLPHSILQKNLGIEGMTPTRRPFLRTAKALIDLYEEKLTLRVGKDELVYYADKSEKNKDKNCVHAISIIDFSKEDPFSGSTTNSLHPSSSPVKTSDNIEKFTDELAPLDSLPSGNDDSTLKKEFHEVNFQVYSNPLFEFDESFRSSNVNPLFEENNKDVEIKSSSSSTLTSPEASELEDYLEKDSIPPGIDLTLPTTLEVLSSNPTFPTLTGEKVCSWKTPMFFSLVRFVWKMMTQIAIRKKIICLLATFLNKKPKPLSLSQAVEEIKEKEDKISSNVPIHTIVMPIRITFNNPIDFNDHFSKPKDLKKDLTISFNSTTKTSILPHPLLDSDSPFTAEGGLSASDTF